MSSPPLHPPVRRSGRIPVDGPSDDRPVINDPVSESGTSRLLYNCPSSLPTPHDSSGRPWTFEGRLLPRFGSRCLGGLAPILRSPHPVFHPTPDLPVSFLNSTTKTCSSPGDCERLDFPTVDLRRCLG